jgi:hypothetical protein
MDYWADAWVKWKMPTLTICQGYQTEQNEDAKLHRHVECWSWERDLLMYRTSPLLDHRWAWKSGILWENGPLSKAIGCQPPNNIVYVYYVHYAHQLLWVLCESGPWSDRDSNPRPQRSDRCRFFHCVTLTKWYEFGRQILRLWVNKQLVNILNQENLDFGICRLCIILNASNRSF